jgi:transposase
VQKQAWRAEIVLLPAAGLRTDEIMPRTGNSKTCVWRWQEHFMEEGVEGPFGGQNRPGRIARLGRDIVERNAALTQGLPFGASSTSI